jgi:hypothetical protein
MAIEITPNAAIDKIAADKGLSHQTTSIILPAIDRIALRQLLVAQFLVQSRSIEIPGNHVGSLTSCTRTKILIKVNSGQWLGMRIKKLKVES